MITTGQAQRKLEAAQEHLSHITGAIRRGEIGDFDKPTMPGTAAYHIHAVKNYLREAVAAFSHHLGTIDGQLCPYQDCCWDCGFDQPGFYRCPHCGRVFYATGSDSDAEDWHAHKAGPGTKYPTLPENIPTARDLGPSWGTPQEDK